MGLGAAIALLSLAVLGGCPQTGDGTKENTEQFQVTNIPATVGGKDAYKIFVRVSTGTTGDAGWVAKGEQVIGGKDSVTMDLKGKDGNAWTDQGRFGIAVVISPSAVTKWEDIDVYGNNVNFSSKVHTFKWGSGVHLNESMKTQVQQLFDGRGLSGEPGIICNPESGIDYSAVE
jgi:hypothetical protein